MVERIRTTASTGDTLGGAQLFSIKMDFHQMFVKKRPELVHFIINTVIGNKWMYIF